MHRAHSASSRGPGVASIYSASFTTRGRRGRAGGTSSRSSWSYWAPGALASAGFSSFQMRSLSSSRTSSNLMTAMAARPRPANTSRLDQGSLGVGAGAFTGGAFPWGSCPPRSTRSPRKGPTGERPRTDAQGSLVQLARVRRPRPGGHRGHQVRRRPARAQGPHLEAREPCRRQGPGRPVRPGAPRGRPAGPAAPAPGREGRRVDGGHPGPAARGAVRPVHPGAVRVGAALPQDQPGAGTQGRAPLPLQDHQRGAGRHPHPGGHRHHRPRQRPPPHLQGRDRLARHRPVRRPRRPDDSPGHPTPLPEGVHEPMTRIMRDSTTAADIPTAGIQLVAGYLNGKISQWSNDDWNRFAGTSVGLVTIDVDGSRPDADVLDVETGDASVTTAVTWVKNKLGRGPSFLPILYCNRSTLTPLFNALLAAGFHVNTHFKIWIGTLDGTMSVPDMTGVVAVQYAGEAQTGGHYDQSAVYDDTWKAVVLAHGVLVQLPAGAARNVVSSDQGRTWR